MKKSKIILIVLAIVIAVGAVATAGVALGKKADLIDFGEIVLDGVPVKEEEATRIMSFNVRCKDDPEGSIDKACFRNS